MNTRQADRNVRTPAGGFDAQSQVVKDSRGPANSLTVCSRVIHKRKKIATFRNLGIELWTKLPIIRVVLESVVTRERAVDQT
jgi:hypothetical protein